MSSTEQATRNPKPATQKARLARVSQDAQQLVFLLLTGYLLLALLGYHRDDPGWTHASGDGEVHNSMGRLGAWLADMILWLIGYPGYLSWLVFAWLTWSLCISGYRPFARQPAFSMRLFGMLVLFVAACALAAVYMEAGRYLPPYVSGGGVLGQFIESSLHEFLGTDGYGLVMLMLMLIGLTLWTGIRWLKVIDWVGHLTWQGWRQFKRWVGALIGYARKLHQRYERALQEGQERLRLRPVEGKSEASEPSDRLTPAEETEDLPGDWAGLDVTQVPTDLSGLRASSASLTAKQAELTRPISESTHVLAEATESAKTDLPQPPGIEPHFPGPGIAATFDSKEKQSGVLEHPMPGPGALLRDQLAADTSSVDENSALLTTSQLEVQRGAASLESGVGANINQPPAATDSDPANLQTTTASEDNLIAETAVPEQDTDSAASASPASADRGFSIFPSTLVESPESMLPNASGEASSVPAAATSAVPGKVPPLAEGLKAAAGHASEQQSAPRGEDMLSAEALKVAATPLVESVPAPVPEAAATAEAEPVSLVASVQPESMLASAAVEQAAKVAQESPAEVELAPESLPDTLYEPPGLELLDAPAGSLEQASAEGMQTMSGEVETRLADFGIKAEAVAVQTGPVVTRYELQPAPGVKGSQITNLSKDLARSLSVTSVRVVEVIPGKSVIGLEIPNRERETVSLREILASKEFRTSTSPLTLALGKDISGRPRIMDLARMPHLLVAGTTGSGKSVALNVMILSLLYRCTPQCARLILIDPKMLELSVYEGIPHLLAPVVTDMKMAANALRWCVGEMERRYRLMAALGVRNLEGYHKHLQKVRSEGCTLHDPLWQDSGADGAAASELGTLPYVVVVIDELADLMMITGKKVEELIARLAQKARAAGIHLVLATQRPSVDVITGLIKANIPARIAFQVSARVDSRTVLDQMGAETLLGHGDMLFLPPGSPVPLRVHGAFVGDEEVRKVAEQLRTQGTPPDYQEDLLLEPKEYGAPSIPGIEDSDKADPLFDEAVQVVVESRRASISYVQRRLKIGYNRAARLIEEMERVGVVGPQEASGNREVLAPAPDGTGPSSSA